MNVDRMPLDEYLAAVAERQRILRQEADAYERTPEELRAAPVEPGHFRARRGAAPRRGQRWAPRERANERGRFAPDDRLILVLEPLAAGGWQVSCNVDRRWRGRIRDGRELGLAAAPLMRELLHRLGWPAAA